MIKFILFLFFYLLISCPSFSQQYSEQQKTILTHLKSSAYYDSTLQLHLVFKPVPKGKDTLQLAAQNKLFFANDKRVLVFCNEKGDKEKIVNAGFALGEQVAVDVYAIATDDVLATYHSLQQLLGKKKVVFDYTAYTSCAVFNDTEVWPTNTNGRFAWLTDGPWTAAGVSSPTTHDLDSVTNWRNMHIASTPANPNIVVNIFDGGFDDANPDFNNRVIWKWNFTNNSSVTNATNHGSSVTSLSSATANNNYGGVGLFDGPIRMYQLGDGVTINVAYIYVSLDSLTKFVTANPTQRQVSNFSFRSGDDPVFRSKVSALYNLKNSKLCFFQIASGNDGAIIPPGNNWPEMTTWGATNGTNSKPIAPFSNTGDSLDFVNDGQGVWGMQANGSFTAVNGTSFSTPLGTGAIANIIAQDTSRTNEDVRQLLREGAKDLGAAGFDPVYGWGWARTGVTLKLACVYDVPASFDAINNPLFTYAFTPRYYNKSFLTNRRCYYPNGSQVPFVTNGDGTVTFNVVMNSANGFTAANNLLRYEFTNSGCVTTIYTKPFSISNLAINTGITDPQNPAMFIRITPNPASQLLSITGLSSSKLYQYVLSDYTGRSLLNGNISQSSQQQISINTIPAGVYLLRLYSVQQRRLLGTEKIIVVH